MYSLYSRSIIIHMALSLRARNAAAFVPVILCMFVRVHDDL